MSQEPLPGYEPSRVPLETRPPAEPRRGAGFLVGAIVQVALGGVWTGAALLSGARNPVAIIMGSIVLAFGMRSLVRYHRSRQG
jgi:hypothetical protein